VGVESGWGGLVLSCLVLSCLGGDIVKETVGGGKVVLGWGWIKEVGRELVNG
jgi:hypothetical protein